MSADAKKEHTVSAADSFAKASDWSDDRSCSQLQLRTTGSLSEPRSGHNEETAEHDGEEQGGSGIPIDRGWAWMIVLGCFVMHIFSSGGLKSFGVFFVELEDKFNTSSKALGSLQSVTTTFALGLGPVSNALSERFTCRRVVMIGGLLAGSGYICTAYAPSFYWLYLTYGVMIGTGFGLSYSPFLVMVGHHFVNRRALANGISVSGSGVGLFMLPNLVRYLLKEYSFQGCLLIIGGFMLNICMCGALVRPLASYKKRKTTKPEDHDANLIVSSLKPTASSPGTNKVFDKDILQVSQEKSHSRQKPADKSKSLVALLDWSVLVNPVCIVYLCSVFVACLGYDMILILLPSYCEELGYDKDRATFFFSIIGVSNVCGRLFVGWFSDLKLFPRRFNFIGALGISGVLSVLLSQIKHYEMLVFYCCTFGFFGGTYFALIAVVLADSLGVDKLSSTFGFVALTMAFSMLSGPLIVGGIRDATGSWDIAVLFCGLAGILSASIAMLEPFAQKKLRAMDKQPKEVELVIISAENC